MSFSTQTASRAEMRFAGDYLNWAGIALLLVGMLSLLRTTGWADSGWLQCALGGGLGIFLSWAGDRAHRQGLNAYAHPMLAAGSSLMLLTLGAARAYFHLIPTALAMLATFALVCWSGVACLRYRSPWLGAYLLITLYAGPLVMNFSLSLVPYLLAIHLATTVVAYRQRWDYFLLGSFVGTYALFLAQPQSHTLGLLVILYALFLLSGSGFALLRRDQDSEVNLYLTSANSLLFAFVSYRLLLFEPNARALLIYFGLAGLHLLLAGWAAQRQRTSLLQANLALGILYGEAAVSFLTYCSSDTGYFALTTFAWLAQALLLVQWGQNKISRRGSYTAVLLAAAQLIYVIPTMDQPFLVELPGGLALLAYFVRQQRLPQTVESRAAGNLVMVLAFFCAGQSLLREEVVPWGLLAGSAFVPVLLTLHGLFPETLRTYRKIALVQTALVCLAGSFYAGPWLIPMGAFVLLADRRAAALIWIRYAMLLPGGWGLVVALAMARWLKNERLEWAVAALALLSSPTPLALLSCLALGHTSRALLAMKLALLAGYATPSSLLWCLLGAFHLRRGLQTGELILGVTFYKVIFLDANFVISQGRWEVAGMQPVSGLQILMATAICACYLVPRSNLLNLLGMLIAVFETSRVVYDIYGQLDTFQVILSAFWAGASLIFIVPGAYRRNKLSRLFGLTLLVACVAKMYAVDIWILDAYDKSTTTLVMGALLMLVSFVYQRNRTRLEAAY